MTGIKNDPEFRIPEPLGERLCHTSSDSIRPDGEYVVYWMRTAMRAHENPALDVATTMANALGVSMFVLQTLADDMPFANDRLHTFALESMRDVQIELESRGIAFALQIVERHRDLKRWKVFQRAALVVTEEMPVVQHRACSIELVANHPACTVDASCIVPMPLTDHAPERAFRFRNETENLRAERLVRTWATVDPERSELPELDFDPIDLRGMDDAEIADLVASREIDHLVGPVRETRGGGRHGYRRWTSFVRTGLSTYGSVRNDPTQDRGVSRMSAYLHLGCVSPFRLAREAASLGANKYLDELLVWRELAWHFCYHTERLDRCDVLPDWARKSLDEHARDLRPKRLSWESLARGRSGEPLWDAAQRSLLKHGELHNNVRMTWGKAFVDWTESPAEALRLALDLNHRYALDGQDPASYGGILWCFGLFDRPFAPDLPVRGAVRPREVAQHAARLDVGEWARHVDRPVFAATRVAVVGGGVAGLVCARTLQDHGISVTLFDKGRGPGGRMSTRRTGAGPFDHGTQFFTAFDRRMNRYIESWRTDGIVAAWTGGFASIGNEREPLVDESDDTRYAGVPRMSALTRHLANDLRVAEYGVRVVSVERSAHGWRLSGERAGDGITELGAFDRLVLALPAPQAGSLLEQLPEGPELERAMQRVRGAKLEPCWAVMVEFPTRVTPGFDAARVQESPIAWVARESSKPGRPGGERWVIHATPIWSRAHIESCADEVATNLVDEFRSLVSAPLPRFQTAHRWRFARVASSAGEPCVAVPASQLVLCGDWCLGPRVGDAWLSGAAAAGRLMGYLDQAHRPRSD